MKKIMSFILITATLLLSGCNKSQQEVTTSTTSVPQTTTSTSETTTEPEPLIEVYESRYQLSNPNADNNTKKLYDYINDVYGTAIITGQQESTWMGSPDYEMDYIFENTGKYPAIRGLDFMNNDFDGVVERSIEWHEKGGIVTICWHTGVISSGYQESKDDNPDFSKLLTEGTDEYNEMIESWDKAAVALQELRDAGVPVLWRPFHEFDGGWFWWGKGGAENFIKLWRMMYDRYTNYHGLDNRIWVLGYSHKMENVKDWYPGDEYCDIIGADTYDIEIVHKLYRKMKGVTDAPKPLCLHECGENPTEKDLKISPGRYFLMASSLNTIQPKNSGIFCINTAS